MEKVNCEQYKCSFHPDNDSIPKGRMKDLLISQCPICEVCKADQHIVNPSCPNCLLCESKEGYIRKGQPKPLLDIEIAQEISEEIPDVPLPLPETPINKKERRL